MPVEGIVRHLRTLLWTVALCAAADKHTGPVSTEDESVRIAGTAYIDRQSVTTLLGSDPGIDLIVVEVKLAPRGDTKVNLSYDDFTLITRKDGQRSQPLAPAQIAGRGALVVNQGERGGIGGMMNGSRGPIWGGVPGTTSRPRRVGGDDDVGGSSSGTTESSSSIKDEKDKNKKENPLLATLKERALPEREIDEAVSGLLYFMFEGKQKLKDIELMYKGPSGRLILDFQK